MQFSDWSLNGGSQIYRNGLAAGLTDIGGILYEIEDGRRDLYSERNGKSGLWRDEDFTDYWVEAGKLHAALGVLTKFVPFAQQERPAWDLDGNGRLNHEEANNWFRVGNGQTITLQASSINLSAVDPQLFATRSVRTVNLLNAGPIWSGDGQVHGSIELTHVGGNRVTITPNWYDFDVGGPEHEWFGGHFWRNIATMIGGFIAHDMRPGQRFLIQYEGEGNLRSSPIVPQSSK